MMMDSAGCTPSCSSGCSADLADVPRQMIDHDLESLVEAMLRRLRLGTHARAGLAAAMDLLDHPKRARLAALAAARVGTWAAVPPEPVLLILSTDALKPFEAARVSRLVAAAGRLGVPVVHALSRLRLQAACGCTVAPAAVVVTDVPDELTREVLVGVLTLGARAYAAYARMRLAALAVDMESEAWATADAAAALSSLRLA
jgi:hypothetical protein